MGEIKDKISKVESGNNYKAVNKASNASGKYQFVRSTWEGLGYDWDKRFDEKLQEEAMAKLTSLNKNAFISKFKTEPTDSDLYGMHFLGTAGYSKVKQANPNTPISELIKGQAYNLNKNVFEKNGRPITVAEFNGWLTKKMGTGVSQVSTQPSPQEQPQVGYVGMLPNGLPDVYGQPYVAEEKVKEEETTEAPKRTDNANKLGFVADYEELAKQYEQQLQAQQKPILQQEIVEGVQYQPIQQNFQEGGTWSRQQQALKAEKDAKLKKLLEQERPVYKKKTLDEKIAEKRKEQTTRTVVKDNTATKNYNDATKHSNDARNKTDKEIAEERKAKIQESVKYQDVPFTKDNWREVLAKETQATGDKFRVNLEPNFFDDYLNPAVMIGNMAGNLGQAPLQAEQTNSYMPYVTAVGTPLAVGTMAGYGTQNTGQFINNLANPLAGTGEIIDKLGNKFIPKAYTKNPFAFTTKEGNFYRQVDKETFQEGVESGVIRGKQDTGFRGVGGINLNRNFGDLAYYNKNTLYYPDNTGLPYLYESTHTEDFFTPMVNNRTKGLTRKNTNVRVSNTPLNTNDPLITTYKSDWLQGYKPLNNGLSNPSIPIYRFVNQNEDFQDGGVKIDPQGYWNPDNEGKPVIIPSPSITTKGISYPIYGKSLETGEVKLMTPNNEYFFANTKNVLETPIYEKK